MAAPKFEDQMRRLEEIVGRIESGDAGLDQSIELCQEASKLVKKLKKKLNEAELKVQELSGASAGDEESMAEEKEG